MYNVFQCLQYCKPAGKVKDHFFVFLLGLVLFGFLIELFRNGFVDVFMRNLFKFCFKLKLYFKVHSIFLTFY